MKGILITSKHCEPCKELQEEFAEQLKSGEIIEKVLEDSEEEVLTMMKKYGADLPSLLILSDSGQVIVNSSPSTTCPIRS